MKQLIVLINEKIDLMLKMEVYYLFVLTVEKKNLGFFDYHLLDLIGKFILLCKYKAIHISEMANHEVKKEYNKLSTDFRKFERYFYTHIYQPSENYDKEFLDGMSNLLVR